MAACFPGLLTKSMPFLQLQAKTQVGEPWGLGPSALPGAGMALRRGGEYQMLSKINSENITRKHK